MTTDDTEGSAAYERWQEQLEAYLDGQDNVEALRSRSQPAGHGGMQYTWVIGG